MSQAPDEIRKKMADPFTLGGFIPDIDRNGIKEVLIEHGTGRCTQKTRREETDAALSKVGVCPYTGLWRAPFTYAYFNTRIIRRSNQMLADMENRPYGRHFNFQEFMMLPPEAVAQIQAMQASGGGQAPKAAGPSVADEKEMLEAQGKYYKQGEGPPLEDLGDAWIAAFMWAQTTSGKELRCSICGCDGYFETARCAVEWAMTVRFDYDKLPHKGGVLNATVIGQEHWARRLIASGPKFTMGSWLKEEDLGPPGFEGTGTKM